MPEKCENACSSLARLEQQVDDIRERNGADHKEFRDRMKQIELEDVRQAERFDRIMDTLNDMKTDNRELLSKVGPLSNRVENLERLSDDVGEIKEKPAKNWDALMKQIFAIAVAAIAGIIFAKIGLG